MTYNPSSPETAGLEWLIDSDLSSVVLDSATKAFGHYFPGAVSKMSQSIAAYASAISGQGVFGCEVYSAPYAEAVPQAQEIKYAGTDTGSDFTSPSNGNAAWLTQAGGAATYASVSPGVDDTTYLRNVNQVEGPTPARCMMRGAASVNTGALAGKRVLSVEIHVRIKSTLATAPIIAGALNIGGTDYIAINAAVKTNVGYTDMAVGYWELNPSTGLPWRLEDVNNIVTAGATDEFGFVATWNASYTSSYADAIRVSSVYLVVRTQPEDRLGYAAGTVTATGWQTWTAKSVPNLLSKQDANGESDTAATGSWVADSNTTLTNDADDPGAPWTRSFKTVSSAAGAFGMKSGYYPCIAGKTYAFRCYAKVTSGRTTVLSLEFYDANGNLLQTSSSSGDTGTGSYKAIGMTAVATAPTGATQMKAHLVTTATAGSQTCFAAGLFVGLDQSAINFVRDTYPGALTKIKVDGATEVSEVARGLDELVVFRRISGTGLMSMPKLPAGSSTVGMPLDQQSYSVILQDGAGAVLDLADAATPVTALVSTSLDTWDSAEGPQAAYSQPYAVRVSGKVNAANTIESEMTLTAKTYQAFRLVVAGEIDEPAAALSLKLKRRSDNAQAGGTATINPTDLVQIIPPGGGAALRTTPQVFVVAIPSAAANSAAQYYVEASSSAAAGSGWVLYALDTVGYSGDSVSADTIVYGAGTDAWNDPANGGELTRRNGMITVQTAPAAPTNVACALVNNRPRVTWTGTSTGVTFEAMEVWRSNDRPIDSTGYEQIADLTDEAITSFTDAEARRGVAATYKIRIRRIDGSLSDFSSATSPVTPTVNCATDHDLLLVSNEAPFAMYVSATGMGQARYQPPDERVFVQFSGRDGGVAFRPTEDPLDAWDRDVALYWHTSNNTIATSPLDEPPVTGRAAFATLEALCRASLSYVCVLDIDGNRWFASVAVKELRTGKNAGNESGGYFASISVRELTRTPSTPTASPA